MALVPSLFLAFDPGGWAPFGPAKWLVLSALGAAAIAATCARLARGRRVGPGGGPGLDRRTAVVWLGFLVLVVVAAARGVDGRSAWLGTPERHLGVVTWVLLAGLFAAAQRAGRAAVRPVARALVVALVGLDAWAIAEWAGHPPVRLAGDPSRFGGPFGSAALLGGALVLTLPAAGALAADRAEHRWWRIAAAVAAAAGAVPLLGSESRAALVALAVAAAVLGWVRRRDLTGRLRWVVAAGDHGRAGGAGGGDAGRRPAGRRRDGRRRRPRAPRRVADRPDRAGRPARARRRPRGLPDHVPHRRRRRLRPPLRPLHGDRPGPRRAARRGAGRRPPRRHRLLRLGVHGGAPRRTRDRDGRRAGRGAGGGRRRLRRPRAPPVPDRRARPRVLDRRRPRAGDVRAASADGPEVTGEDGSAAPLAASRAARARRVLAGAVAGVAALAAVGRRGGRRARPRGRPPRQRRPRAGGGRRRGGGAGGSRPRP